MGPRLGVYKSQQSSKQMVINPASNPSDLAHDEYFLCVEHQKRERAMGASGIACSQLARLSGLAGKKVQRSAQVDAPSLVNFITAVAYISAWPCLQHSRNLGPAL